MDCTVHVISSDMSKLQQYPFNLFLIKDKLDILLDLAENLNFQFLFTYRIDLRNYAGERQWQKF